jgi:hypothetical protein
MYFLFVNIRKKWSKKTGYKDEPKIANLFQCNAISGSGDIKVKKLPNAQVASANVTKLKILLIFFLGSM